MIISISVLFICIIIGIILTIKNKLFNCWFLYSIIGSIICLFVSISITAAFISKDSFSQITVINEYNVCSIDNEVGYWNTEDDKYTHVLIKKDNIPTEISVLETVYDNTINKECIKYYSATTYKNWTTYIYAIPINYRYYILYLPST